MVRVVAEVTVMVLFLNTRVVGSGQKVVKSVTTMVVVAAASPPAATRAANPTRGARNLNICILKDGGCLLQRSDCEGWCLVVVKRRWLKMKLPEKRGLK